MQPGPNLAHDAGMKKPLPPYSPTDEELLLSMLFHAMIETEAELHRTPTKEEVLDHLFSECRDDPEALDLEYRLQGVIARVFDDWAEMDEWAQ